MMRDLPKGIFTRNGRFTAYIYRGESADGKQHWLGSFTTVDEAVAARDRVLAGRSRRRVETKPAVPRAGVLYDFAAERSVA